MVKYFSSRAVLQDLIFIKGVKKDQYPRIISSTILDRLFTEGSQPRAKVETIRN